jgi:hypothetical protein
MWTFFNLESLNPKKWDKYYFLAVTMLFIESVNDETMKPSELGNR